MRRRVLSSVYPRWIEPADVFVALYRDARHAFWLDSGSHADHGMSYLGSATRVFVPDPGSSVFEFLRREAADDPVPAAGGGFALGWVGWLGYELRGETTGVPVPGRSRYPDAALLRADRAIAFDHATHTVSLLALGTGWSGPLARWREETVAALHRVTPVSTPVGLPHTEAVRWADSDEEYLALIAKCQEHIVRGEAYQLCLTTRASVEGHFDPVATYLALREASPTHHGALLRVGEIALLSSSPEVFLTVSAEGAVESKPIKGTRPRDVDPALDGQLRAELLASGKERAENLMIVDLMRNDLSRICTLGSVRVSSLLEVESYAHVHQLVSTVRGQLAAGVSGIDAVVACFPAGSMTGAPKLRATQILDRLEQRARGIYSGVFGYFGADGRIELAMVIRSIVLDAHGATVGAGGGITVLSVPGEELAEVKLKAAALLGALGVSSDHSRQTAR